MGFSRQKYSSGLPFSSPEDLPDPGIKPWSSALQADLEIRPVKEILKIFTTNISEKLQLLEKEN